MSGRFTTHGINVFGVNGFVFKNERSSQSACIYSVDVSFYIKGCGRQQEMAKDRIMHDQ
jgi:hypothetical protein